MVLGNTSERGEGRKGRASERSEIAKNGLCMDLRDIFKSIVQPKMFFNAIVK